jgi:uncharacterized protein YcfJ
MLKYVNVPLLSVALMVLASPTKAETVTDVTKRVIQKTPYQVEVCQEQSVSGDKTADTLMGAIIGGAIGNNVTKNVDNGGAVGALLGGMIAHNNSKATGGTRQVCRFETRYNEEEKVIYSHSVVTFTYMGRTYSLSFQK